MLARPVVTYWAEMWTLKLQTNKPWGSLRGDWSEKCMVPYFWIVSGDTRSNHKIKSNLGHADIVGYVKSRRRSWLGHVQRMDGHPIPKILSEEIYGMRITKKMITDVGENLRMSIWSLWMKTRLTVWEKGCSRDQDTYWTVVPVAAAAAV